MGCYAVAATGHPAKQMASRGIPLPVVTGPTQDLANQLEVPTTKAGKGPPDIAVEQEERWARDHSQKVLADAAKEVDRAQDTLKRVQTKVRKVPVFYATTRLDRGANAGRERYSALRNENPDGSPKLSFGICWVSLPPEHIEGLLETPWIKAIPRMPQFVVDFFEDERDHVILFKLEQMQRDNFFRRLKAILASSVSKKHALVFVHGYNVSFSDACRRTGQLAVDLKYPGVPILYSWPSDTTLAGWSGDYKAAQWSGKETLAGLLASIIAETGVEHLHVIAHSLGNVPVTDALALLARERKPAEPRPIHRLILAAPAIGVPEFRQVATALGQVSDETTIYVAQDDRALLFARTVDRVRMVGDAFPTPLVFSGLNTIDISPSDTTILQHLYYGDNRTVLDDIEQTVRLFIPIGDRLQIKPEGPYWVLKPR